MPSHNFIDLTGQVFGQLTVLKLAKKIKSKITHWECLCSCGNLATVQSGNLKNGNTKSCGCLWKKAIKNANSTHKMIHCHEYQTWRGMKQRCYNPKTPQFKYYGGRGITICDEWRNDFMAFYNYIGQIPSKNHSIDRIDNNCGYQPGNVRWATIQQQANNKQNNHKITLRAHTMSIIEWATFVGIKSSTIRTRLHRNWPIEKAIFAPIKKHR